MQEDSNSDRIRLEDASVVSEKLHAAVISGIQILQYEGIFSTEKNLTIEIRFSL